MSNALNCALKGVIVSVFVFLATLYHIGMFIVPSFWMRKLRLRKVAAPA